MSIKAIVIEINSVRKITQRNVYLFETLNDAQKFYDELKNMPDCISEVYLTIVKEKKRIGYSGQ